MAAARVTALLPVKSFHGPFLDAALASLTGQTSADWRLVAIADPGDVETVAAALGGILADPRAVLVASDGRGLPGALNTGMRVAETEFVAILLGDDLWAPEAVAVLDGCIERHPEIDFFHSARAVVDEEGRRLSAPMPARESFTAADFARYSPVKHLLCWRRSLGLAVGGIDETLDSIGADDYDFPWTMAEHGARFLAVQDCLYLYRDHRACFRLTTHVPRSIHVRSARRRLRKHGVGIVRRELTLLAARYGYLRQCLYRSRLDRWWCERTGRAPRRGQREAYPLPVADADG